MATDETRDAAKVRAFVRYGRLPVTPRRLLWLPTLIRRRTLRDWMLAASAEAAAGDEARDEAVRLRKALRFYAAAKEVNVVSIVLSDCGKVARDALGESA